MLKLNASYSKKVPAGAEYSSQSYHASIEVELPDGLSQEQLQQRIHETFEMVRDSVEVELGENNTNNQRGNDVPKHQKPPRQGNSAQGVVLASPKQINYLLDLARGRGINPQQLANQYNVGSVNDLSKQQCSELINSWRAA